jgi:hypothetical protein
MSKAGVKHHIIWTLVMVVLDFQFYFRNLSPYPTIIEELSPSPDPGQMQQQIEKSIPQTRSFFVIPPKIASPIQML